LIAVGVDETDDKYRFAIAEFELDDDGVDRPDELVEDEDDDADFPDVLVDDGGSIDDAVVARGVAKTDEDAAFLVDDDPTGVLLRRFATGLVDEGVSSLLAVRDDSGVDERSVVEDIVMVPPVEPPLLLPLLLLTEEVPVFFLTEDAVDDPTELSLADIVFDATAVCSRFCLLDSNKARRAANDGTALDTTTGMSANVCPLATEDGLNAGG
jgi:hypothetical protein